MHELEKLIEQIKPTSFGHFDRIMVRAKRVTKHTEKILRANCREVWIGKGRPLRDFDCGQLISFVCPNREALEALAELPGNAFVNGLEIAIDFIVPDDYLRWRLTQAFRNHNLQPWHGSKVVRSYPDGYSTRATPEQGERNFGHWNQWYADKPSKITGDPCLHWESKRYGSAHVKRIGLVHPADLLTFDFRGYLLRQMRFYEKDLERLGRWHSNRQSGAKRKQSRIDEETEYNFDRSAGAILYRIHSVDPPFPVNVKDDTGRKRKIWIQPQTRSLQAFRDAYGTGPFLTPMPDVTSLLLKRFKVRLWERDLGLDLGT